MCRILRVVVVAPSAEHLDLRRRLSSLEYEVVATVEPDAALDVSADVALLVAGDAALVAALRDKSVKTVAVGGDERGADLTLADASEFPSRVWELFRAR